MELFNVVAPNFIGVEVLGCNHLRSLITLDKTRRTYENFIAPRILICVDTFNELGTFAEFESQIITAPYPMEHFCKDVQKLIQGLSLTPFNSGYVELALRETDVALYKQGRYLIGA